MSKIELLIQHNGTIFEPVVKSGITLEWERSGSPGKLTFTTVKTDSFAEGDPVYFHYDGNKVFMGYVFKKKRDKDNHIEVTCYDQIRYLKNKFMYIFENKKASEIIQALCADFKMKTGTVEDTKYVIPVIAEENISALDIAMDVLEETTVNTGEMFVLYDNYGSLEVKNISNMVTNQVVCDETAENFDYSSSIDDETYNDVVLYYKGKDNKLQTYTASSKSKIKQWGVLRYFEEVDSPTIAENKAKSLLKLYCKKTRSLQISGVFGDIRVRGGSLIPVKLNLGDVLADNYMLVEKVTHKFEENHYTMDITVQADFDGEVNDITTSSYNSATPETGSGTNSANSDSTTTNNNDRKFYGVTVESNGINTYAGKVNITHWYKGTQSTTSSVEGFASNTAAMCDERSLVRVNIIPKSGHSFIISNLKGDWRKESATSYYIPTLTENSSFTVKWVR